METVVKLKELTLYIISKCPGIDRLRLSLYLFMSDFGSYAESGKSITDAVYIHGSDGPEPRGLDEAIKELEKEGRIEIE